MEKGGRGEGSMREVAWEMVEGEVGRWWREGDGGGEGREMDHGGREGDGGGREMVEGEVGRWWRKEGGRWWREGGRWWRKGGRWWREGGREGEGEEEGRGLGETILIRVIIIRSRWSEGVTYYCNTSSYCHVYRILGQHLIVSTPTSLSPLHCESQ